MRPIELALDGRDQRRAPAFCANRSPTAAAPPRGRSRVAEIDRAERRRAPGRDADDRVGQTLMPAPYFISIDPSGSSVACADVVRGDIEAADVAPGDGVLVAGRS